MKKILMVIAVITVLGVSYAKAAAPSYVVETAPQSNELNAVITCSTASTSAVDVSSSAITRIDSAFNTAASAACGANYQRAGITVQNNSAGTIFCGYSSNQLTVSNGFAIYGLGGERFFKLGKSVAVYCLAAAGSKTATPASVLIVGGVAWK